MTADEIRDECLKFICEQTACIFNPAYIFTSRMCAKHCGCSIYRARKALNELVAMGYLVKDHDGGYDDWSDKIWCLQGYSLTKKGDEHPYYIEQYRRDVEWFEKSQREWREEEKAREDDRRRRAGH